MNDRWRFILDGAANGAWNMAVDEALRESAAESGVPSLRLYRWSPACLSIGANQAIARTMRYPPGDVGVDWVRRPSGGRALLHDDELTYAICLPEKHPMADGGVRHSSQRIAGLLKEVLERLGVAGVTLAPVGRIRSGSPACYAAPSDYELLVSGRKLIGSAQIRGRGALLQHGCLPLAGDPSRLVGLFAVENPVELTNELRSTSTDLTNSLGHRPEHNELVAAFQEACNAFRIELAPSELNAAERARATILEASKYRDRVWSERR